MPEIKLPKPKRITEDYPKERIVIDLSNADDVELHTYARVLYKLPEILDYAVRGWSHVHPDNAPDFTALMAYLKEQEN